MNKIDVERIKKMTNNKIGYSNYEDERKVDKRKHRIYTCISIISILIIGVFSVNALTDNKLLTEKKLLPDTYYRKIKINGNDDTAKIYRKYGTLRYDEKGVLIYGYQECIDFAIDEDSQYYGSTLCFPEGTTFDDIELYYDEYNHFKGHHITGTMDGKPFDDKMIN